MNILWNRLETLRAYLTANIPMCSLFFSIAKEWDFLIESDGQISSFSTFIYCTDFSKLYIKAYQFCQLSVSVTHGTRINDNLPSCLLQSQDCLITPRWRGSSTEAQFQTGYSFLLQCDKPLLPKQDSPNHQEIFLNSPHTLLIFVRVVIAHGLKGQYFLGLRKITFAPIPLPKRFSCSLEASTSNSVD